MITTILCFAFSTITGISGYQILRWWRRKAESFPNPHEGQMSTLRVFAKLASKEVNLSLNIKYYDRTKTHKNQMKKPK
jgi:hypothetical protein